MNLIPNRGGVSLNIDWATSGIWWQEIGRAKLGIAGDTLSVVSIPPKRYLRVQYKIIASGTVSVGVRVNNDSANNYSFRYLADGVSGAAVNQPSMSSLGGNHLEGYIEVVNSNGIGKSMNMFGLGGTNAGTAPNVTFIWGWWNGSAIIDQINLFNTAAGDFAAGSEIVVLGHD